MPDSFEIENGILYKYNGTEEHVVIPDGVTAIGQNAFSGCSSLKYVSIPESVTRIEFQAFFNCTSLISVNIPDSVTEIGPAAFFDCADLESVSISEELAKTAYVAFNGCKKLADSNGFIIFGKFLYLYIGSKSVVSIPDGVTMIGNRAFRFCNSMTTVNIPDSVTEIGDEAFADCRNLISVSIPDSVTRIGRYAFRDCTGLKSLDIPGIPIEIGRCAFHGCSMLADKDGYVIVNGVLYYFCGNKETVSIPDIVTVIGYSAFSNSKHMVSVTIPGSVTLIEEKAFDGCADLTAVNIPESVSEIGKDAFNLCLKRTIICREGSFTHRYCADNDIPFIFDYQFEAFNGLLPPGYKKLASPFLADEEKPYIFISYSHKDRESILGIIRDLYEAGWKVWYDEGLTIGDRYDETLETHVRNCSAFLLFVTENSLNSLYVKENEIPWAIEFGKPIIKCLLEENRDYEIREDAVIASVTPSGIEPVLETITGLKKGEKRVARGISVVVDPAEREGEGEEGEGFAYCLYKEKNAATAKAILLDAERSGCAIYDAARSGENSEKLQNSACLVVFLDKEFLFDRHLRDTLIGEYESGRDIAVCQIEYIEEDDLPDELLGLYKMQWLNFASGISADMNTKLIRHLQKKGCRNMAVLPGFEYEETDRGIVIKKYTGMDPAPRIESLYGGIPVIEIGEDTFKNCVSLKSIEIPEGVLRIGDGAFRGCSRLDAVILPHSLKEIGEGAFLLCESLESLKIPDSVEVIGDYAFGACSTLSSLDFPENVSEIGNGLFNQCDNLTSFTVPDGVTVIGDEAFQGCRRLMSVTIPGSVTKIGNKAFDRCSSLKEISIPEGIRRIGRSAFSFCESMISVDIPDSVTCIDNFAFQNCSNLSSVKIPKSVTAISDTAFNGCTDLHITCSPGSYAWNYCQTNSLPVKDADAQDIPVEDDTSGSTRRGLFSRIFGKS